MLFLKSVPRCVQPPFMETAVFCELSIKHPLQASPPLILVTRDSYALQASGEILSWPLWELPLCYLGSPGAATPGMVLIGVVSFPGIRIPGKRRAIVTLAMQSVTRTAK